MMTARVERCVRAMRRRRRLSTALYFMCAALSAGLYLSLANGHRRGFVPGYYGTTLLGEDTGGYVLMGVLAFAAGAALTVLCIRYSEKKNDRNTDHTDEDL